MLNHKIKFHKKPNQILAVEARRDWLEATEGDMKITQEAEKYYREMNIPKIEQILNGIHIN